MVQLSLWYFRAENAPFQGLHSGAGPVSLSILRVMKALRLSAFGVWLGKGIATVILSRSCSTSLLLELSQHDLKASMLSLSRAEGRRSLVPKSITGTVFYGLIPGPS